MTTISDITHDTKNSQLTMEVDGFGALIDYKIRSGRMYLTHSEVSTELRGNGIGKILIEKSLELLVKEGYDKEFVIIAKCPFIKYVVAKNPRWKGVVS